MAEPVTTELHRNGDIPDSVTLAADEMRVAFTPRELTAIRQHFGKSWGQVMADTDTDDKFVILAWLKLRRDGFNLDVADMQDVVIELDVAAALDPTRGAPPTISPPSVATGE